MFLVGRVRRYLVTVISHVSIGLNVLGCESSDLFWANIDVVYSVEATADLET